MILGEDDFDLRSAPRAVATAAGFRFVRSGPSGTLRERFARRLPKSIGHVGTVRGSFRLIEAGTSSREHRDCAVFARIFGAGEGIRTLDPDLGKVVLYP
jgi:hypothetical protein